MFRFWVLLVVVTLASASCGNDAGQPDLVALIQADSSTDVAVIRVVEADFSDSLRVCRIPHGDHAAIDRSACADVDPLRWTRESVAAQLQPGPEAELLIVTHDLADFRLNGATTLEMEPTVVVRIPPDVLWFNEIVLRVHLATSDVAVGAVTGCIDFGLAGGAHPVMIQAEAPADPAETAAADTDTAPAATESLDASLNTSCVT